MIYKCYFDGSYKPHISGCAFCVIENESIVYSNAYSERLPSSQHAEAKALYMLLRCIHEQVTPESVIEVYGDDKGLIERTLQTTEQNSIFNDVKNLYEALKLNYIISLTHIPRDQNRIAHNMSRILYNTQLKSKALTKEERKKRLEERFIERRHIFLDDIYIPDNFKNCTLPSPDSFKKRLMFFTENGCDHKSKTIRINPEGKMIGGYITYLISIKSGISSCFVDVYSDRLSQAV